MGFATSFTSDRMLDIEQNSVVAGLVDLNGDLILEKKSGSTFNAGHVVGPEGPEGPQGPSGLELLPADLNYFRGDTFQRSIFQTTSYCKFGVKFYDEDFDRDYIWTETGWKVAHNRLLWAGSPAYLNASQTVTFNELLSDQLNGIVTIWSGYSSGALDYDWNHIYISKHHVSVAPGSGFSALLNKGTIPAAANTALVRKYFYVHNDRLVGHSTNSPTGTQPQMVIRYVIGV